MLDDSRLLRRTCRPRYLARPGAIADRRPQAHAVRDGRRLEAWWRRDARCGSTCERPPSTSQPRWRSDIPCRARSRKKAPAASAPLGPWCGEAASVVGHHQARYQSTADILILSMETYNFIVGLCGLVFMGATLVYTRESVVLMRKNMSARQKAFDDTLVEI
jgi:hypothetical protein